MIEKKAYAKINLTLEVGKKRPDGYHSLTSVMARTSLFDSLYIKKNALNEIRIFSSEKALENSDNLCYKAVKNYFEFSGISPEGIDITLDKKIPLSAGLGGGSADAAAVIEALEELFKPLPDLKRHALALSLGADVPYCLKKMPCLCKGIGDECEEIQAKPFDSLWLVIEKNAEKLSTGAVYKAFDSTPEKSSHYDHQAVITALETADKTLLSKSLFNDFERVVFPATPEVKVLKEKFLKENALTALMSGAGPTVVAFFESKEKALSLSDSVYELII